MSTRRDHSTYFCCKALQCLVSKRLSKLHFRENNKHLGSAPSKTQNIAKIQTYSLSGRHFASKEIRERIISKKCTLGVNLLCIPPWTFLGGSKPALSRATPEISGGSGSGRVARPRLRLQLLANGEKLHCFDSETARFLTPTPDSGTILALAPG